MSIDDWRKMPHNMSRAEIEAIVRRARVPRSRAFRPAFARVLVAIERFAQMFPKRRAAGNENVSPRVWPVNPPSA